MKKILLLWVMGVMCLWAQAQTITLRDKESGRPLEGATLISDNPRAFTTTNATGKADISAFAGSKKIQIQFMGYKTLTTSYDNLQQADFVAELEPARFNLDEIVVAGTRWRQAALEQPAKIATITPQEEALQNPQTAADLLGISGKVFIQKSQQAGGSPMIRGFATNRLIYSVDGVRMNSAIFRSGNIQNVINLDPFAIENTEVLFGPGSVIYGSDAIGGVMSFQTLTPQLSHSDEPLVTGKAVMRTSSANKEKTGHFDVGIGWKKWALVTSFSSWDFDHLKQGSKGPSDYIKSIFPQRIDSVDRVVTQTDPLLQIPSAYSQINLMQKVRFQPNAQWNIQYGFHFSETSTYGRYDRHNRFRNGTIRYAEWDYGPQRWMMNNLSISHGAQNALYDQLSLRLAYQQFEESRIERTLNRNNRSTTIEEVEAYSVNLDLIKTIGTRKTFYYGVEYVTNDVTSTGIATNIKTGISQTGPARYPNSTWRSIAAYFNNVIDLSEKLTLQTGLRYNHFKLDADFTNNLAFYPFPFTTAQINNGALTGSLGTVYRPDDKTVLRASVGSAFRAPNVDDIGKVFDSEPGAVTVPNPNLKAEYAGNIDVGLARLLGEVARIELTGYYTELQNALVRRNFQLNGQDTIVYEGVPSRVQAIQNAAVAKVYGVQASVEVKLPAGFFISSDLNYQKGEEELDDGTTSPSRHAAPLFGVTRVRYQKNNITLEWNVVYQGQRSFAQMPEEEKAKTEIYAKDANGNNYSPSWYTLNVKAVYQLNEVLSVSSGVENLTDQRYRPYSSGISGPGRNFVIALRARF
jgi:hemoglobin/transferrin/lactoferrin receptor protein